MKILRFACILTLVAGATALGTCAQEPVEIPADPTYSADSSYATPVEVTDLPLTDATYPVEVAQAPRASAPLPHAAPAATLSAPVARATGSDLTLPTPQTITPEMWYYSQELNRHDDPAQAVRRKAELRAEQRMGRIAALKWYGMSNSRPQASTVPMMGMYSPAWVGGGFNPYEWTGPTSPTAVLYVGGYDYVIRR